MNIYVNGDSYTAGAELADLNLTGFPGYRTSASPVTSELSEADKHWANTKWEVARQYFGNHDNYINAGKALAWPSELSKLDPNILVKNGSKTGASMTGIAHRTVADLLEYKLQGIEFDRVFIQLTSCHRFEIYDISEPRDKFIIDKALGWLHTLSHKTHKDLGKSYIAQYKDTDYAIKFLYTVCTLRYAIKGLTGNYPVILSSLMFFTNNVIDPLKNNDNPVIQTLINNSGILDIECCMETIHKQNKFLYLPISHFEQRTHQTYAKVIYDKYIK